MIVRVTRPPSAIDIDLSASWDSNEVLVDNTPGQARLLLGECFPAGGAVPDGFSFVLRKAAPQSNSIHCKPVGTCTLHHFWKPSDPHGRYIILAYEAARLTFDAVAKNWLFDSLPHLGYGPRSQRTVIVPSYQVTPESICELIECNTEQAGGAIYISVVPFQQFCPASPITGGNYLSWPLSFVKVDNAPHWVTVAPSEGQVFHISNDLASTGCDRGYIHLKEKGDGFSAYISAGGFFVTAITRACMLP